ncbi:MAG: hypothetical protein LBR53_06165 [Deltaproteobacteria bacterium]|jgi:hypothetical protein|nr:hypothetical protein [Deltaproteobacteria bacterium]
MPVEKKKLGWLFLTGIEAKNGMTIFLWMQFKLINMLFISLVVEIIWLIRT